MKPGEEEAVSELISRTFRRHIAPGYSDEGVREFLSYIEPSAMRNRSGNHSTLVTTVREVIVGVIVGVIEVRDHDHISLLFVDSSFQRRGIAGELLDCALAISRRERPELETVSVHSSPNAVPAYKSLGFRVERPEQVESGIRFVPMTRQLTRCSE